MRPASIGIVPPACENSHLMSGSREKLPLSSRLVTVRPLVFANGAMRFAYCALRADYGYPSTEKE
jgi:hypothetical protein